ncbi:TrmB family transcriptional regulator [Brevibacillus sp. SYP-B805]|uniref:TrmB family transcriptional regulator n=1 Tax=Brevibacillus sp. SYP-B805 TaxID=1578199 RepID=UPI0013EDB3B9|nr:TrmB family transcriptional regulator [Brevibacillus sp. SYP-B805]NGQ93586.1 TrmB family transcriptional regulator [Brevibacillus sp. SYP-B805]
MDKLIDCLMKIGFSNYESKAYLSLLRRSPVTGYELSKQSGVPRSMIYQTINKLVSQGAVHEIPSDPLTYTPVPPKEFLGRLREEKEQTFNYLEEKLQTLESPPEAHVIHHIKERMPIMDKMKAMISKARHEVWLSLWDSEVDEIQPYAKKALDAGVRVYSLLFDCEPTSDFGKTYYHPHATAAVEEQRLGQRLTVVVCDHEEVIIAGFSQETIPSALHTEDPLLVLLAKEYIRHDIMMKVMTEKLGAEHVEEIWKGDPDLFYLITNKLLQKK